MTRTKIDKEKQLLPTKIYTMHIELSHEDIIIFKDYLNLFKKIIGFKGYFSFK